MIRMVCGSCARTWAAGSLVTSAAVPATTVRLPEPPPERSDIGEHGGLVGLGHIDQRHVLPGSRSA